MWLCTTGGFFSIVAHRDIPERFLLRWRFAEDTETVRSILHRGVTIKETPDADYAFRAEISYGQFILFLDHLARRVDYTNFKGAAGQNGQWEKLPGYHRLWQDLKNRQDKTKVRGEEVAQ